MKVLASELKIGDVIMPPPREVQLWMRRTCKEKGLPESALHLTITGIRQANPDVRGEWLLITADQTAEWCAGYVNGPLPFKFKVRPQTPWATISRVDLLGKERWRAMTIAARIRLRRARHAIWLRAKTQANGYTAQTPEPVRV